MTRYLLDTHPLIWWAADSPRLAGAAREAISGGEVFVSAASVWEMEIKRAAGKLDCPDDVPGMLRENLFQVLAITPQDAVAAARLPRTHGDPFDRMLVAQARAGGLVLITCDEEIAKYDVAVLAA